MNRRNEVRENKKRILDANLENKVKLEKDRSELDEMRRRVRKAEEEMANSIKTTSPAE